MIKLVLNASRGAQWTSRDNELYCHKCGEVSVGKGAYDDETKLANSYCPDCLAEVMRGLNQRTPLEATAISGDDYERMMREAQND